MQVDSRPVTAIELRSQHLTDQVAEYIISTVCERADQDVHIYAPATALPTLAVAAVTSGVELPAGFQLRELEVCSTQDAAHTGR